MWRIAPVCPAFEGDTDPMRRLCTYALAVVALLGAAVLAPGVANATVDTGTVVQTWKDGNPVYQAPGATFLTKQDADGLATQIQDPNTGTPIFLAILRQPDVDAGGGINVKRLEAAYNGRGTFIILGPGGIHAASNVLSTRQIKKLSTAAVQEGDHDPQTIASILIDKVSEAAKKLPPEQTHESRASGAGAGTVVLVGLGVVVVIALLGALVAVSARSKRKRRDEEQFAAVRATAEEDVTLLGEDVARLDLDVRDVHLDPDARRDYEGALDAYERAKSALETSHHPQDLRQVAEALEDGRYRMTCVRARLAGEPLPERRAPCFFNPQHGPSVTDRPWAPPGGSVRDVPVCAADAARLDAGEQPDAREVLVDGVRRPYWEGGPAYGPWYGGYYGSYGVDGLLTGMLLGSVLSGGLGGLGGYDAGYEAGYDAGVDNGWGGGDFGGGDSGGDGGDWGGGDFGGGDFGGGGDWGGGDF